MPRQSRFVSHLSGMTPIGGGSVDPEPLARFFPGLENLVDDPPGGAPDDVVSDRVIVDAVLNQEGDRLGVRAFPSGEAVRGSNDRRGHSWFGSAVTRVVNNDQLATGPALPKLPGVSIGELKSIRPWIRTAGMPARRPTSRSRLPFSSQAA